MKNKFIFAVMLLVTVVVVTSCATQRKYGCPSVNKVSTTKTAVNS